MGLAEVRQMVVQVALAVVAVELGRVQVALEIRHLLHHHKETMVAVLVLLMVGLEAAVLVR
jgi:hypothetical protein